MTDIEKAARAEAERRWPWLTPDRISGDAHTLRMFQEGASWLAEHLLSDENVEKAARVLYTDEREWFGNPKWPTWDAADEVTKRNTRDGARATLQAVLGKKPEASEALRPTPDYRDIQGRWSNGDPVHIITDGTIRRVAPNLNGATWIPGI